MSRRRTAVVGLGLATVLAVGACSNGSVATTSAGAPIASTSSSTTSTQPATDTPSDTSTSPTASTPSTTATVPPTTKPSTPTVAPPADADGKLVEGESGKAVLALQTRLSDLGFWLGQPDGGYGFLTSQAVMAFQKSEGLSRDGVAGPQTMRALKNAGRARTQLSGDGIEINLDRQLLLVVRGGRVRWALNTSTGSGATFTSQGVTMRAVTPRGHFTITRQIEGWHTSPLGKLWRPKFFNGGIAIHGALSIPGYPASHGCARLSTSAMDLLWGSGLAPIGTRVVVT